MIICFLFQKRISLTYSVRFKIMVAFFIEEKSVGHIIGNRIKMKHISHVAWCLLTYFWLGENLPWWKCQNWAICFKVSKFLQYLKNHTDIYAETLHDLVNVLFKNKPLLSFHNYHRLWNSFILPSYFVYSWKIL